MLSNDFKTAADCVSWNRFSAADVMPAFGLIKIRTGRFSTPESAPGNEENPIRNHNASGRDFLVRGIISDPKCQLSWRTSMAYKAPAVKHKPLSHARKLIKLSICGGFTLRPDPAR